jgi:hypothetical protein
MSYILSSWCGSCMTAYDLACMTLYCAHFCMTAYCVPRSWGPYEGGGVAMPYRRADNLQAQSMSISEVLRPCLGVVSGSIRLRDKLPLLRIPHVHHGSPVIKEVPRVELPHLVFMVAPWIPFTQGNQLSLDRSFHPLWKVVMSITRIPLPHCRVAV